MSTLAYEQAPALRRAYALREEWIDFNGHMGDFAYAIVFTDITAAFMDHLGMDAAYREAEKTTLYTLDLRIGYLKECHFGQSLDVSVYILEADRKRIHAYLEMRDEAGQLLAWNTQVLLHVSQAGVAPKAASFPAEMAATLTAMAAEGAKIRTAISHIDRPLGLGR